MSIHHLQGLIRQEAMKVLASKTFVTLGTVTDYDPVNFLAVVQLYPEDSANGGVALNTGWLPIFTPAIGVYMAPNLGDIVEVHFAEGSLQNGYVSLRGYNASIPPPQNVNAGEILISTSFGTSIYLDENGNITITATGSGVINVNAPIVNVTSPEINLGNGTLTELLNGAAQSIYNTHTHNVSGGVTLAPNQTMGAGTLTTNTKAS